MRSNQNWLINSTGDIVIRKNISLTNSKQTITQRLYNKISLNYGEWFLHDYEGINWFGNKNLEGHIGKKLTELILDSQIQDTIKNDEDVDSILEYETSFNLNGNYQINLSILTKDNEIIKL